MLLCGIQNLLIFHLELAFWHFLALSEYMYSLSACLKTFTGYLNVTTVFTVKFNPLAI